MPKEITLLEAINMGKKIEFTQGEDGRALLVIKKELLFLSKMNQLVENNLNLEAGVYEPVSYGMLLKLNQNLFIQIMN